MKFAHWWRRFRALPLIVQLAVALALLAVAFEVAAAPMVARRGADVVRITDAPCTNAAVLETMQRVVPVDAHGDYRAATATINGRHYQACWRKVQGTAHMVYDDGDQGIVPWEDFKPVLTV